VALRVVQSLGRLLAFCDGVHILAEQLGIHCGWERPHARHRHHRYNGSGIAVCKPHTSATVVVAIWPDACRERSLTDFTTRLLVNFGVTLSPELKAEVLTAVVTLSNVLSIAFKATPNV
jgi:hypothetical protein